jgi:hypothetical protein
MGIDLGTILEKHHNAMVGLWGLRWWFLVHWCGIKLCSMFLVGGVMGGGVV